MVAAIIQARFNATRLPGKVLKKLLDKTLLEQMIERLKRAKTLDKIIVATTDNLEDGKVADLAKKLGLDFFRGSENDVLDRYYQAAKKFGVDDVVVRLTGDCPLIDPELVDKVVDFYKKNKEEFDYASNVHPPTFPDGMDVEVFSFKAMEKAWHFARLPSEREHLTAYIVNHPEIFRIGNWRAEEDFSGLRLTVDNEEDFLLVEKIYQLLYQDNKFFTLNDILKLSESQPSIFLINQHMQRNEGYLKSLEYEKGVNYVAKQSADISDKEYPLEAPFPKNLMIELTNACNLKCVMCYNRLMKRKRGFMDAATYGFILDNAAEIGIKMVGLYTTGESFLHPQVFDFIRLAKEKGFEYIYMTTNGNVLNEKKIKKIFDSGLDSIKFSIDGISKESYEKIRVGGNFEKLYNNIKALRETRDALKSKLKIYASFVLVNNNYHELKQFKEFWKGLIDEVMIVIVGNQANLQVQEFDKLIPEHLKNKIVKTRDYCNLLWNRIIMTYDGKFTLCSEDFEGELIYGDIREESMREAWNNVKMKAYRSMWKTRDFHLSPRCLTCTSDIEQDEALKEIL